jgi:hypothetical protein
LLQQFPYTQFLEIIANDLSAEENPATSELNEMDKKRRQYLLRIQKNPICKGSHIGTPKLQG